MDERIVVVIPTFGRNSLLERTLESLAKCDLPQEFHKTIIIENGPKGNAELVSAKFTNSLNIQYLYCEVANKSSALNEALKFVDDNSWVIFFDDDIRLSPPVIKAYFKAFTDYGHAFFYGGPVDVDYQRIPSKYYALHLPFSARGWEHNEGSPLLPNYLLGCNWGVSKRNLQKVGTFDSNFGPNSATGAVGQEHNMMFRLYDFGVKPKYISDAKVWHYVPKERSSLSWALKRKFKGGVSYGIQKKDNLAHTIDTEIKRSFISLLKAILKINRTSTIYNLFNLFFLFGIRRGVKTK
ncbi:glycosyltransferase [Pontibacter beigongshangensis]|uniref:glycosyltransferase n=1 Tax=Pontibacter beigongshangensis TaxID=2574733 RepID=UPI001650C837|nr:glycosyltransferase family 2 protein [Pontibacter beigongshangensis]